MEKLLWKVVAFSFIIFVAHLHSLVLL